MRKVEAESAQKVLLKANKRCKKANDEIGGLIEKVLRGSHKTYRYVLVTALLAKSTNSEIDALSLQAGDESEGAYDARSLCHTVIVPFERKYYPNGIGGSNEPFLNKPARFTRLSEDNAVRRGNDMEILKMVITILSSIKSAKSAFLYLSSAIYDIAQISKEKEEKYTFPALDIPQATLPQTTLDYIVALTKQSFEGEISPLVVSALEHLYYEGTNKVIPHKVNESGTSSKEVGDIDVFTSSDELLSSIEVKDKDFTKEDVEHAIHKFALSKVEKSLFIFGRKVNFDKDNVFETAAELGKQGFYCSVISIEDYAKMRIYSINRLFSINEFVSLMLHFAHEINAKDDTVKWIKDCAAGFVK